MFKWLAWGLGGVVFSVFICSQSVSAASPVIRAVVVEKHGDAAVIRILADQPIGRYHTFKLGNPERVVVDLFGCRLGESVAPTSLNGAPIRNVRLGRHRDKIRVAVDLVEAASVRHRIRVEGGRAVVRIEAVAASKMAAAPEASSIPEMPVVEPPVDNPGIATEVSPTADDPWAGEDSEALGDDSAEAPAGWTTAADDAVVEDEADEGLWDEGTDNESGMESADGDPWREGAGEDSDGMAGVDRFEIGGRVLVRLAHDIKENDRYEDDAYGHGEALLEAKYNPGNRFQAVLSVDADYYVYHNTGDWDADSSVRLHEAYINISAPWYNLKTGNQIVRWGKADGYSPLDNLNPEDFRDGIAGKREERKLTIPMVNAELYHGGLTIQGIYIPVFIAPELDHSGTDWSFFRHADQEVGVFPVSEDDPSHDFSNSEFGVRISGMIRNLDYAFSWLHTREDLPVPDTLVLPPGVGGGAGDFTQTDLAAFAAATGQTIFLRHNRQNVYGVEIETTWRDFGVRADLAYFDNTSYFTDDLRLIRSPVWQYILGADYNGPEGLYVNLQFYQTIIQDYDDLISWGEEVTNAFTCNLVKEYLNGNIEFEFQAYVDISGDGTMLNPEVRVKSWEPVIIGFGTEFLDGSVETAFGLFEDNDQVYGFLQAHF